MSNSTQALEQGLKRIRVRFINVLDERLDLMEAQYAALDDRAARRQALTVIQSEAHKISGTARTVGFPELGETARQVDVLIHQIDSEICSDRDLVTVLPVIDQLIEMAATIVNAEIGLAASA